MIKRDFCVVHLFDDDCQNIVLICPKYLIPALRFICRLSQVNFERCKK